MIDENKINAPYILWEKALETGVENVDEQHHSMINKINEIFDACSRGEGLKEVISALIFLENYTRTHFKEEEALQIECGYPKFEQHKVSHERFIKTVNDMLEEFYQNGTTMDIFIKIIEFMADWIKEHIKKEDVEFSVYYKEFKGGHADA